MSDKDWQSLAEEEKDILDEVQGKKNEEEGGKDSSSVRGALEHPSYKELEDRLTALEEEVRLEKDKAMRAMAEADNARRRAAEEVRKARDYSLTEFARDLLAVSDSLDQALTICAEHPAMKEGLELTLKQLHSTFDRFSVKVFDPIGEKFDPLSHEAMTMVEVPNTESGKIITVFQKGYWISDRLLRPARVVVAK
jgi:molecular chaperone GrpE